MRHISCISRISRPLVALLTVLALSACSEGPPTSFMSFTPTEDTGGIGDALTDLGEPDDGGLTSDGGDDAADTASDADSVDAGCVEGTPRPCFSGDEAEAGVGACFRGIQTCADGEWGACVGETTPAEEFCDDVDNDCDGETDEGVSNACGVCGPVQLEVCDDGLDNDCNGIIDGVTEGCACGGRLDQPCYSGPPHTLGVGLCVGGSFDCVEGDWSACEGEIAPAVEVCDELDNDCDGLVDEGTRNACGSCDAAVPTETCDGIDNDCDGTIDEEVRALCGICIDEIDPEGEVCGDGFDNNCDGEVDEGCTCNSGAVACYPGPIDSLGIGVCSPGTRGCDPTGELWGPCEDFILPTVEVCDGLDNDCDGTVDRDADGCSVCGVELEICDGTDNDCDGTVDEGLVNSCGDCLADVIPEETLGPEYCDGMDDDCDGLIDEGLLNECGTCDDEGCSDCEFFVPGWSDAERCGDGQDNDNDGVADEDCPCEFGSTQSCFLGAPNSRRIGQCLDGSQTCVDRDDPHWGPCEGGILPGIEICDDKDNDCNGCVDEGECDVLLTCPIEDFAFPLSNYELRGGDIYAGEVEADSWRWIVEAPVGSASDGADNPNSENTSVYLDVSGDYLVTLEVTVEGSVFTCTFIVHAQGRGLRVELIWDEFGNTDLDLHLHRPGSTSDWCDAEDTCYYANCDNGSSPNWGYEMSTEGCPDGDATCRNPRLDIDNINGFDPENINLDNPNDGDMFRIMVHEYSKSSGVGDTLPEVRIYCGGVLSAELGVAPDTAPMTQGRTNCRGDTWRVADVTISLDPETGVASCEIDILSGSGPRGWDIRRNDATY